MAIGTSTSRGRLTLLGFLLLFLGFLSIMLSLIGVQFAFMTWLDALGRGVGFLARLGIMLAGFILIFMDQPTDDDE